MDIMRNRDSNFELLRIVCMIFIVWGHFINKFSVQTPILGLNYLETHFFKSFTIVAVNVFILISGYFSITFRLARLLKLAQQTWFYSVFFLILGIFLGTHVLYPQKDILFLCPIFSKIYWFITIYIMLYILSPALNKMSSIIPRKQFKSILLIGLIIIYIWHTFSFILNSGRPIDDAGYGIINFIYLYLLGRYIRMHIDIHSNKHNFLFLYCITSIVLFVFQLSYSLILGFSFTALFSYNTILVLLGSVFLFLFFARLDLKYNPLINNLAKYSLAIYIIHTHPCVWDNLCNILQIENISSATFIPYSLFVSIASYLLFALVEKCRLYFFNGIENKINDIILKTKIVRKIEGVIKLENN